jgi:hypothetical protein
VNDDLYVVLSFSLDESGGYDRIETMTLCTENEDLDKIYPKDRGENMTKKIKLSIYLCIVLVCVGCKNNSNADKLEINYSTDYNEGTDKSDENINFENPYFYSQTDCLYSADIQYIDVDTVTTINGELELQWLKEYNNGNLYKLMVEPDGNIIDYLGNERLIIYFYVTADKIYRLWSYVVQDGKLIEFYNNDILLIETLNTDEKLIKNGELVCCMEDKTDELELSEVGKHVTIVQQGEQITYNRVDIGESGNREFYETFVWVKGNGLVEYKSGYRMEADILYIDNIFMKLGK